jgi:hypothetical protein
MNAERERRLLFSFFFHSLCSSAWVRERMRAGVTTPFTLTVRQAASWE